MAAEGSPYNDSRHQAIPLQDLSRSPDQSLEVDDGRRHRNSRSRNILGGRRSFTGRVNTAYERVDEGSPPARGGQHGVPHITTPRNAHQPYPYDDGEVSPVDAGGFATAMSSVGLSFEPSFEPTSESPGPSRPAPGRRRSTLNAPNGTDDLPALSMTPTPMLNEPDTDNYFSPQDNDQTPLTDPRYLAPISGSSQPQTQSASHSRMGSRLGDDLNVESGRGARPPSTLSSWSSAPPTAGSTLSRAGTIIRQASQRIVNLSNEPDAIESHIRRRRSTSQGEGRMEAPPALPAMHDYAHDDRSSLPVPVEKVRPMITSMEETESQLLHRNPLRGKSLGIFGPESPLRLFLCEVLVHPATEPVILILIVIQTIVLAIDSATNVQYRQKSQDWKASWANFVLLALFGIYTLEIAMRIIVSGFVKNAEEYSTNDLDLPVVVAIKNRIRSFFTPQRRPSATNLTNAAAPGPSILRSFTNGPVHVDQPGHSRQAQRLRLARRAFLRHGFNRLDFLAVISFWISFFLAVFWIAPYHHIYVFKMLSCLRILRLLGLTSGTSVILRSLKKAAPLLVNVAFLIGFFWLLFAIIGVQSFKASFRRTCIWTDSTESVKVNTTNISEFENFENFTWNKGANIQFCGGYINMSDSKPWPWLRPDPETGILMTGTSGHKGYLCPEGSLCLEGTSPYNNTVSFDNIGNSLELVFVVISANTFSDLLYYTTNSDFLAGALFFAFGIMIMSFWLTNLLVAVITSSFQVIREESKTSAFTADDEKHELFEEEELPVKISLLKSVYDKTHWLWIIFILVDLIIMCLRSSRMGNDRALFIDWTEKIVTILLDIEIVLRFLSDWRNFHRGRHNWVDLALAIVTSVIQIPAIHDSGTPYAWLSLFQILRIYRVVLGVPITRELIVKVLGNASGLLNLIIFVFLLTFLTAIFAVQIFQGEFPPYDMNGNNVRIDFKNIYNSFIGMYQVLSSENWTILLYNSTQYQQMWGSSWIGATFFILWFILANFIVLNMFIAFITENFDVSEDEKRLQQVKAFLQQKELGGSSHGNLSLATILKLGRDRNSHRDPLDYGPANMEMLLQEAVFRDFLDEQMEPMEELHGEDGAIIERPSGPLQPGSLSGIYTRILKVFGLDEPNPFYSGLTSSKVNEEQDIRTQARYVVSAAEQRKKAQRQYVLKHPTYNVSLYIFSPSNPIRRFCQRIVGPGRGNKRFEGVDPIKPVWYAFSAFIYAAIVAMVIIACVTTPLYQREYFYAHGGYNSRNWFTWTDMGFAVLFTIEALIKVIADGLLWTPNAFFRGSWGFIDGIVLVTLWINVITSLYKDGAVSRAVGAFKALRALRLLQVSDSARDTFHSVIILGGWKVVSAAFVSLSLLFPFAIYGLNLFNGQMRNCNDNGFSGDLSLCVDEYHNQYLFSSHWNILQPRAALNPYYNFDDFGNSLSILFQIVSEEGWTDVMWTAMEASGVGQNLVPYNSQGNAVFFIIFNLLGTVFVLTLFVSVFMRNYTEQTGVAFLTADQRSWLELRKLLRQINPSKRPSSKSENGWKAWCYRIAVKKHGRWQRCLTLVLCFHLILLCLEFYPEPNEWQTTRDLLFLAFTVFYIANVVVRIIGLTWRRFRKSSWDLYSIFSVTGTVITTVLDLSQLNNFYRPKMYIELYGQLHKLFLVSITLLLIPRNNQLDQLFKTAAASLSAIGNLLATWFVLFVVFAIALTQTFGLTRFGPLENGNLNFRNVPKALILLFRMSCGEGWNAIMEDFATIIPPSCVENELFYESDCGSAAWARSLFIAWNILSMYIFVSLFVSLIFESFSYVYQRSNGLSVVSREEIRRFKQAWATFDPDGTGFIPVDVFPRLLGELSGVFEMRIYAGGDHSVGRILESCAVEHRGNETPPPGTVHGIDLAELNRQLRMIDVHDVRRRRQRMEIFFQEILVSADKDRGVNFTSCLMILAHYNVISDSKALRLEEYLRRRARLQRVEEEVNRRVVKGFFDTMYWTRKFQDRLNFRHSARMVNVPQFAVPEIFIDDQDAPKTGEQIGASLQVPFTDEPINVGPTHQRQASSPQRPGRPSLDTTGIRHRGDHHARDPSSAGDRDNSLSPSASPHRGASLSPRHSPSTSAAAVGDFNWTLDGASTGSLSPARRSPTQARSRAGSSVNQSVLDVFDNSAWGESIKRSFTTRRNGPRGGRGQASASGRAQGTVRSRQGSRRESLRPSPQDPSLPVPSPDEGNYI